MTVSVKKGKSEKQLSEWEKTVYSPKLKEVFDPDASFILKLRDYAVHYALPAFGVGTSIKWKQGDVGVSHTNRIRLKKSELLKWGGWGTDANAFLFAADDWIEFLPVVEEYMKSVRKFYQWFWDVIEFEQRAQIDEYKAKGKEFWLWYALNNVRPDWIEKGQPMPPDWPSTGPIQMRRKRAAAKMDRYANGTRGWRSIEVDTAGQVEVGDSDWQIPD
ncbi:hypothetical protein CH268_27030 [Rhodococcus sp. 06-1460-1B]|nr:hypothetical protein CH268_27030 [Rhodococcus sp. 06-1460-1B]